MTKSIRDHLDETTAKIARSQTDLAHLTLVHARFPDAEVETSAFSEEETKIISAAVHDVANRVSFAHFPGPGRRVNPLCAVDILYTMVGATPVYSRRPVDLVAGFEAFNANGGALSLIDALRATTPAAEALVVHLDEARAKSAAENASAEKVVVQKGSIASD